MAKATPSAAEIQKFLKGADYLSHPTGEDLRQLAVSNGADQDERAMEFFEHLPNKEYSSPTEVEKELHAYASESDDMREAA